MPTIILTYIRFSHYEITELINLTDSDMEVSFHLKRVLVQLGEKNSRLSIFGMRTKETDAKVRNGYRSLQEM